MDTNVFVRQQHSAKGRPKVFRAFATNRGKRQTNPGNLLRTSNKITVLALRIRSARRVRPWRTLASSLSVAYARTQSGTMSLVNLFETPTTQRPSSKQAPLKKCTALEHPLDFCAQRKHHEGLDSFTHRETNPDTWTFDERAFPKERPPLRRRVRVCHSNRLFPSALHCGGASSTGSFFAWRALRKQHSES